MERTERTERTMRTTPNVGEDAEGLFYGMINKTI